MTHQRNNAAMATLNAPKSCRAVLEKLPDIVLAKIKEHADKGRLRQEKNAQYQQAEQSGDWEYQARFEKEIRDEVTLPARQHIDYERPHYDKDVVLDAVRANPEPVISQMVGKQLNARLSKGNQLVWGEKGSVRYFRHGAKEGLISDFEQNLYGDAIRYYQKLTGKTWKDALVDVAQMANVIPGTVKVALSPEQRLMQERRQLENEKKSKAKERRMRQYAIDGWREGVPIKGTIAETYLKEHRKITGKLDELIFRFQPRMKDFGASSHIYRPALLVRAKNNEKQLTTAQAIYLDPKTGQKADLSVNKRSFGSAEGQAALIYAGGGTEVIVAEGPETCASIAQVKPNANIYSSLGRAATMGHYAYLCERHNTDKILIAADNDDADPKSTTWRDIKKAAIQLSEAGVEVSIAKPMGLEKEIEGVIQPVKTDFNDLLQEEGSLLVKQNLRPNFKVIANDEQAKELEPFKVVRVDRKTGEIERSELSQKQNVVQDDRLPASVITIPEKTVEKVHDISNLDKREHEVDF